MSRWGKLSTALTVVLVLPLGLMGAAALLAPFLYVFLSLSQPWSPSSELDPWEDHLGHHHAGTVASCGLADGRAFEIAGEDDSSFRLDDQGAQWTYRKGDAERHGSGVAIRRIVMREGALYIWISFERRFWELFGPRDYVAFSGVPERCFAVFDKLIARSPHLRDVARE